jgi:branched-subunit amino acid aminotransferase/4-amino-4-deoxychorismate lyase
MQIPFDDHMVIRGHSVFDTCTVYKGNAYQLDRHISRLTNSALKARIELPMQADQIKEKILSTVALTQEQTCAVRMFISAGPGDVGIAPMKGSSCLYLLVLKKEYSFSDVAKEYTCKSHSKTAFLTSLKSTNYLLNALTAMSSQDRGGQMGVVVDDEGQVLESCVASVGFVLPGGHLVTPTFDKTLRGLSIELILRLAERLKEEGLIASAEQRSLTIDEARTACEMFFAGGDQIRAILNWDDNAVGSGVRGPVTSRLIELMKADMGERETTAVPYSLYH